MKKVELSENALQVASSRYFMNGEDWLECTERVARTVAAPEVSNKAEIENKFAEMIYKMEFLPGGRILRNSSRPRGSLFNCYHLPIGDSIEEIGQFIKDALILWSEGGGVGCNFSPLRPRGDTILGKGGSSSGLVSFIEAADAVAQTIESGGSRRAAAIAHVDVLHPEVIDFIDAKIVDKRISSFNISVAVNHEFLEAVEANKDWTFKFKQKSYSSVKARDIWNKIVSNMVVCAEPGLINWTNFSKNNSYYFQPVLGTNPCHTGDTMVSVADGRNLVSFKQLAEEGKDVPVFSKNDETGLVEVKMMRRPRKTRNKVKIYKVKLDNGMSFRCNETHKVSMFDGSVKRVIDLKENDRLHHMIKYISSMTPIGNKHAVENNFRVVSIVEDGVEDVYNGTVDDNHNYYVYVGEDKTKNGKSKSHFINSRNCGETTLGPYEACDLGSLVLPNFIPPGGTNTNWKRMGEVIKLVVRFLDNIIDVNKYVLKEIDINAHKSRRIGIGVIGLAEYLFAKKARYGSERAVKITQELMEFIRNAAYQASLELSIEKGAFPQFDAIAYGKASFIRKFPASFRTEIKQHGVRNCTLMALAPTGTISLLADYTSAIEPLFAKAMVRHDRVGDRMYIHPKYQEIVLSGKETPDWFVDSFDLEAKDHFEMQVACQKFCDASVSKTINLPKTTTEEDLSTLLLEYVYDLKGVTVYRDGSREGQILNKISEEQVKKYLDENKVESNLTREDVRCATGSCEI